MQIDPAAVGQALAAQRRPKRAWPPRIIRISGWTTEEDLTWNGQPSP